MDLTTGDSIIFISVEDRECNEHQRMQMSVIAMIHATNCIDIQNMRNNRLIASYADASCR
jgi:hypothetical protein